MAAEVKRLTRAGPVIGPEPSVIDVLKEALSEAERGEIKGLGLFIVRANDAITTDYAPGCADRHFMVCGAAFLNHRITSRALED